MLVDNPVEIDLSCHTLLKICSMVRLEDFSTLFDLKSANNRAPSRPTAVAFIDIS